MVRPFLGVGGVEEDVGVDAAVAACFGGGIGGSGGVGGVVGVGGTDDGVERGETGGDAGR